MNFNSPDSLPKICYIFEHEDIKNNTIISLLNKIEWIIEERLKKDPLHNIDDLLYCIEMIEEMKND